MLPGKVYRPEDLLQILRRRKWLFLLPLALVSAGTAVVTSQLPNLYRSDAMIMIVPQGVTEKYVIPSVSRGVEDRLPAITQQLLSRSRLEPIIRELSLYWVDPSESISEDIVEQMRSDIYVSGTRSNSFTVSYTGDDPHTVLKVTERLATSLIAENTTSRASLARGTTQFLDGRLEEARQRLLEHERRLADYRRRFATELPSQSQANVQMIQNTQMQIQAVNESKNRDFDQRLMIQRRIEELRAEVSAAPAPSVPAGTTKTTADELAAARATLQGLEQRFKPTHPDIGIQKRRIRDLEAQAAREAAASPAAPNGPRAPSLAERRLADLEAELAQLNRRIEARDREEARLRADTVGLQRRVDMAPAHDSEMVELTRDYETLQKIYADLLQKKEESKIAVDLEQRQIGEQLRLVDPPRLPERPFSPDRRRMGLIGLVLGLGMGVGLLALVEYRDGTFRTDDEILRVLALPVLAVVPVMISDQDRKTQRLRSFALNLGLGSTVAVCAAVVFYSFVS